MLFSSAACAGLWSWGGLLSKRIQRTGFQVLEQQYGCVYRCAQGRGK